MGNYSYVTNRVLKNSSGEENGKLKAFVRKGSETVEGDYECPECGNKGKIKQAWKRPFNVKCSKCGFLIKVSKIKDEMKREKKKAR